MTSRWVFVCYAVGVGWWYRLVAVSGWFSVMVRFGFTFGVGIVWLALLGWFVGLLILDFVVFTLLAVRWVSLLGVG